VTGSTHFAYLAINGASEIEWFSVSAGSTTPLTNPQKLTVPQPQQVVLHPGGNYLYSVDVSSNVTTYSVNSSTGAPTATSASALAGVGGLNYAVIDPYGRFMYVADDGSNNSTTGSLAGFTINADGSLTGISGMTPTAGPTPSPFTTNLNVPTGLVIDRSGAYLYVINNGGTGTNANTVAAFSIDQTTGALTALSTATVPTGSAPYLGGIDANKHLYVANSVDNTVSAFTIGANGILTQIGTTNFAVTGTPAPVSIENVIIDPSSTHIYIVDGGNSGLTPPANTGFIYAYSLNSDGSIGSALSGSPYAVGVYPPGGMSIDPTGALLGVENNEDSTISPFKILSSGGLQADAAVNTDANPLFITFYNAP
jgi:6-phosphogluconolactonase (cycloisomerase 2 family)